MKPNEKRLPIKQKRLRQKIIIQQMLPMILKT